MKKIIYVLFLAVSMLGFSSCGGSAVASDDTHTAADNNSDNEDNDEDATDNPVIAYGNMLVVYYSFTNNTHAVVSDLLTQIDADVVRVEPAEKGLDYAANNYAIGSALISAIRENPDDASSYPDIDSVDIQLDNYDTVIVAAPLWWSSMAAPLQTFLFHYGADMAGKHIGLIVSSASSGISGVEADAKRLIPGGNFIEPSLWIRSSQTSDCHRLIGEWLETIGTQR